MATALVVLGGGVFVSRSWILEHYARHQLAHGDDTGQWHAAVRLAEMGASSRALAEEWVTARVVEETAAVRAGGGSQTVTSRLLPETVVDFLLRAERPDVARRMAPQLMGRISNYENAANAPTTATQALELARAGDLHGAFRVAGQIRDRAEREGTIRAIAVLLGKMGATRERLRTLCETTRNDEDTWILHPIAFAQLEVEDLDGAFATASKIQDVTTRMYKAVRRVIEALAHAARVAEARTLAEKYTERKAVAYAWIARALAEGGHTVAARDLTELALALTEQLPDRDQQHGADRKAEPLEEIAIAQWKLGDVAESRKNFVRATDLSGAKNERLVPKAQAAAGDIEGALKTVETIYQRGGEQALGYVAKIQATNGDIDGALASARAISHRWVKATTLATVAAEQSKTQGLEAARGTFEEAYDVAGAIGLNVGGTPSRASTWRYVAWSRAGSGDARGALRWAANENSPLLRVYLLMGIGRGMSESREAGSAALRKR